MQPLHRYSWSDSEGISWQALETEICTVKLKRWRNPSPKGRLPLRLSPNGVQMLPVLQVIHLDLVDSRAAANLSLEKADSESQGLFLTSLLSYCVMPTSRTSTIYPKGCSFGIWGMWYAFWETAAQILPLQNLHTISRTSLANGTPWEPVDDNRETESSALAGVGWEGTRAEFGPVVLNTAAEWGKKCNDCFLILQGGGEGPCMDL